MQRISDIDLHTVRLAFQVFVHVKGSDKKDELRPVFTDPIIGMGKGRELTICKVSDVVSPATGGKKILLFCEKVVRKGIEIQFFEGDRSDNVIWSAIVPVKPENVHHQYGIEFDTPPYKDVQIEDPVKVYFQMAKRNTDISPSEPIAFEYYPVNFAEKMKRKRIKLQEQRK